MVKKMRGGQKGNQNARKHGFYSSALTPDEINRYWDICIHESIDPEMAVLRVKLQSLISQSPVNPCVPVGRNRRYFSKLIRRKV